MILRKLIRYQGDARRSGSGAASGRWHRASFQEGYVYIYARLSPTEMNFLQLGSQSLALPLGPLVWRAQKLFPRSS